MAAILGCSREPRRTTSARSEKNALDNRSSQTRRTSPPNNLTSKEGSDSNRRGKRAFTYYRCPMTLPRRTVLRARQIPLKVSFLWRMRECNGSPFRRSTLGRGFTRESPWCFRKGQSRDGRWQRAASARRSPRGEPSGSEFHFDPCNFTRLRVQYVFKCETISFEMRHCAWY